MREHILKTWPQYFDAIARGEKTFEGRRNDRGFQRGDIVILQRTREDRCWEVDKDDSGNPKHELRFKIGFVLTGIDFGIQESHCVFSLLPDSGLSRFGMEQDLIAAGWHTCDCCDCWWWKDQPEKMFAPIEAAFHELAKTKALL